MEECWDLLCFMVKVEPMGFQLWNKETLEANTMAKTKSIASDSSNNHDPYPGGKVRLGGETDNTIKYLWWFSTCLPECMFCFPEYSWNQLGILVLTEQSLFQAAPVSLPSKHLGENLNNICPILQTGTCCIKKTRAMFTRKA